MGKLHTVGAQVCGIGRCAMVGILVGMLAGQAVAQGAPAETAQPSSQQNAGDRAATVQTPAASDPAPAQAANSNTQMIKAEPMADWQSATPQNAKTPGNALPEAPGATEEQASVVKPIDVKAIMDDAAQNTQSLQPTATKQKHQIHPGWLTLTAIGALAFTIGIVPLTRSTTKGKGVAAGYVGVGAGLAGLGLYLTFK